MLSPSNLSKSQSLGARRDLPEHSVHPSHWYKEAKETQAGNVTCLGSLMEGWRLGAVAGAAGSGSLDSLGPIQLLLFLGISLSQP